MMSKESKKNYIEEMKKNFSSNESVMIAQYQGLNVNELDELRKQLREKGILFKVTKNTLTRLASKDAKLVNVDDFLVGQIGVAYSFDDQVAPAKVIKDFIKDNQDLEVIGIIFEGKRFEGVEFKSISNLPNREDLYSKLLSVFSQPMTNLASTLNGAMSKLAYTLESLKQTKS